MHEYVFFSENKTVKEKARNKLIKHLLHLKRKHSLGQLARGLESECLGSHLAPPFFAIWACYFTSPGISFHIFKITKAQLIFIM